MLNRLFLHRWQMLALQLAILLGSLAMASLIVRGNMKLILVVMLMMIAILTVVFNKTYQFLLKVVICYLFLLPWETIRPRETWGLRTRSILDYRVGEHVLILGTLFFCMIIVELVKTRIHKDKQLGLPSLGVFAIYFLLGSISSLLAYDAVESFFGVISKSIVPGILVFYITYYCICNTDALKVPKMLVVVGAICSIYGMYEFITASNPISDFYAAFFSPETLFYRPIQTMTFINETQAYRITSTFGNPEFAATFFGVASILSLSLFLLGQTPRILYLGSFMINSVALLFTFTRGGMVGYAVALTMFMVYGKGQWSGFRKFFFICLASLGISAAVFYVGDYLLFRFSYSEVDGITHRLHAYPIFAAFMIAHPLFGIGFGSTNYQHAYNSLGSIYFSFVDTFDNAYLGLISHVGLLFLIPMFLFARKIWTSIRKVLNADVGGDYVLQLGTVFSLLFVCISFSFYDGFAYLITNSLFWILVAMLFSFTRDRTI